MVSSSKAAKVAALSATLAASLAGAVTINTPSALIQCQPTLLTWGDGVAPFYLAIIPGGQPSAAAIENLPTQSGTSYTWVVNIASGQSVTVRITDSTGATNYAQQVPIQAGASTACMSGAASNNAAPAATSSPAAGATTSGLFTARPPTTSSPSAGVASTIGLVTSVTSGINGLGAATQSTAPFAASSSSKPNSAMGNLDAKSALSTLALAGMAGLFVALAA